MAFLLKFGNSVNKFREICTWKGICYTESTTLAFSGVYGRAMVLRAEIFSTIGKVERIEEGGRFGSMVWVKSSLSPVLNIRCRILQGTWKASCVLSSHSGIWSCVPVSQILALDTQCLSEFHWGGSAACSAFQEGFGSSLNEGSSSITSLPCTWTSQSRCFSLCLLDEEMSGLMSCRCPHERFDALMEKSCLSQNLCRALGMRFSATSNLSSPFFNTNPPCFTSNPHCSAPECPS